MEYADFTVRRAIWQALGLRVDEMNVRDYLRYASYLRAEAEHEARSRK